MVRAIDQIAAALVALIGVVHVAVGSRVFVEPTERGVWFLSAGLLLILIGLVNLCRARAPVRFRLLTVTALCGALAIAVLGALIAASSPALLAQPQTVVLLAIGLVLTSMSVRDLFRKS